MRTFLHDAPLSWAALQRQKSGDTRNTFVCSLVFMFYVMRVHAFNTSIPAWIAAGEGVGELNRALAEALHPSRVQEVQQRGAVATQV
eukprot:scaffold279141_cov13-Tisochrysis_lutea.AAC.1